MDLQSVDQHIHRINMKQLLLLTVIFLTACGPSIEEKKKEVELLFASVKALSISQPCEILKGYLDLEKLEWGKRTSYYADITPEMITLYRENCAISLGFLDFNEKLKLNTLGFKSYDQFVQEKGFSNSNEAREATKLGYSSGEEFARASGQNPRITEDEFAGSSWLTFKTIYAEKYYQDANVWMFFGISHTWNKIGVNDDNIGVSAQGNVAFGDANESDIYFIDNYKNRFSYADPWESAHQKGDTPYGYRSGIYCRNNNYSNCHQYFLSMKDKKLVWRFYNGGSRIADLEIPNLYRNGFLEYFENYRTSFK